jgi:beta-N-acetylhexosaminidase
MQMVLAATAISYLAVALQIGVPVNNGAARGAVAPSSSSGPVGQPLPEERWDAGSEPRVPGPDVVLDDEDAVLRARSMAALVGVPYAAGLAAVDHVWIERTLAALTLRQKVAQLVVPYIEGGQPREGTAAWRRVQRLVTEDRVGGLIVGVGPAYETARWLNQVQSWASIPLLMTADLEWGPGTRLRGATVLPINMAIAAAGSPALAYGAGRITGLESRAAGLHVAYAPVADVNVNPLNPVINTRAYGSDAALVSARVVEFIRGARSSGMMTVAKHFPGHGDTATDSHLALPILVADRLRLSTVELAPFEAAIMEGVDGVMTAHMAVPALDPQGRLRPATLSPPILTDLLRQEMGFGGLIVTDALHMDGVKGQGRPGAVAVAAVQAGADILLIPPDAAQAIDAVVEAVLQGRLSESRIDMSVRRILAAKAAMGLREGAQVDLTALRGRLGTAEHEAWARDVAERSITLVRGEPGGIPMAVANRTVLALIYDDRAGHRWGAALEEALAERGARVLTIRLSRRSGAAELERARRLAATSDLTLIASFSRALPWKGNLGLPEDIAGLINELAGAGAPVVSFGDPYLLRQLTRARTYLLAWSEMDASQRAVARALTGEIPITGRLPIDLPPDYRVGHGLLVPSLPGITTVRSH